MLSAVCALLILVMTRTAFGAFFIGENFEYLGQYRAHGDNALRAAFSTITGTFFRPVLCLASLPWHCLLRLDPADYHSRNFVFSAINVVLFPGALPGWFRRVEREQSLSYFSRHRRST